MKKKWIRSINFLNKILDIILCPVYACFIIIIIIIHSVVIDSGKVYGHQSCLKLHTRFFKYYVPRIEE